jgi:hypothetical protein
MHTAYRYLRELEAAGYIEMNRKVYATMIKINQFDEFMKEFIPPTPTPKTEEEHPPKALPKETQPEEEELPKEKPFKQQPRKNLGNDYWGTNQ